MDYMNVRNNWLAVETLFGSRELGLKQKFLLIINI